MKVKDFTLQHLLKTGMLGTIWICAGFVFTAFSYDITRDDVLVGFPRSGDAPLKVHFASPLLDKVTGFLWDFGDGQTSMEQSPDHVYSTSGIYTIILTVTGSDGTSKEIVRKDYITVYESSQITSDFSAEPLSGSPPLTVQFKDSSTGNITQWLWVFGDDETSSEQNPEHTYTEPGRYTVVLRVSGPEQFDIKRKFRNLM